MAVVEELVILKKLMQSLMPAPLCSFSFCLQLTAARAYDKHLFEALKHMKNCSVLQCEIKPDNMLVNEAKNVLKLCDFGRLVGIDLIEAPVLHLVSFSFSLLSELHSAQTSVLD